MAGILSAIKLEEAGLTDFTVYEKGDRLGGTWRENTYPGPRVRRSVAPLLVLVRAHARLEPPLLARPRDPRVLRARRARARRRSRTCASATRSRAARSRTAAGSSTTARGHHDEVDVVIAATGVLHHPRYPDIEGLDSFAGAMFHSARWDHRVPLDGARVGIIGTGSTAVQIVSAIVDRVAKLSLFQRTAQWIMPQENPAYTDEEKAAFRDDPDAARRRCTTQLAEMFGIFANAVDRLRVARDQDDRAGVPREPREQRARSRSSASGCGPTYRAACKRLIISPDFYDAIQRPERRARDRGDRARRARRRAHAATARLHELDVLVLATGFKADAFMRPMQRHRPRRHDARRRPGRRDRTRTSRSRSPTSRTSSCSTARTARSATSR